MSSISWKNLMNDEWASCILHNLPSLLEKNITVKKTSTISIKGYQDSAATWNYYDFEEKISRTNNISSS